MINVPTYPRALPPQSTIKPKNFLKNYSIWGLLYLFFQEVLSYLFWESSEYNDFYYPLFNQIALFLLLLNMYAWRFTLKFCQFKIGALISLMAYYLVGIFAMIFKLTIFNFSF
jgi:hypothetical protein